MKRLLGIGLAIVAVAALIAWATSPTSYTSDGLGQPPSRRTALELPPPPYSGPGLDLRVLVLTADTASPEYQFATSTLLETGVAYRTVDVVGEKLSATDFADLLSNRPGRANFNAVLITSSDVTSAGRPAAPAVQLSEEHLAALASFQAEFGVRSVTLNAYPDGSNGLTYDGYVDTTGAPLEARLTVAGRETFPSILPKGSMAIDSSGVYLASVVDPNVTIPLLDVTGPDGGEHPVVAVTTGTDGVERMQIAAGNSAERVHSVVLSHGWLEWVTRGVHLGRRQPTLTVHVDDLFLPVGLWDASTNKVGADSYRNSGDDISALTSWIRGRQQIASTSSLTIDFAFVGSGADEERYPDDTLVPAVQRHADELRFINHTFSHYDLDCGARATCGGKFEATSAQIEQEIRSNVARGKELGLDSDWDTMVQPDISGVNDTPGSTAQAAAVAAGVLYWISDTSRPGGTAASFNVGIRASDDSRLLIIPRHPTNLFYDNSTPEEWVDEFNHLYAPGGTRCGDTKCFVAPLSYMQILDVESERLLLYLLRGDTSPLMFHTPNTRAYDGRRSLLTDLLDAALTKYDNLLATPIASPSFKEVARSAEEREELNQAEVAGTVTACGSVIVGSRRAAMVQFGGAEPVSVRVEAGSRETLRPGSC